MTEVFFAKKSSVDDLDAAVLKKDGSVTSTANQPMGGFKHTNVADATADTEYSTKGQMDAADDAKLDRDGGNLPTANLPMGGFKHTGVADAVVDTEYASKGQVDTADATKIDRDGGNSPTANLPMAGFRHTGVDDAVADTDYAAWGQVKGAVGDITYTGAAAPGPGTTTVDGALDWAVDRLNGRQIVFETKTAAEAASEPDAVVTSIRLLGYAAADDHGGADYIGVASEPSHPGKMQIGARWFELSSLAPNNRQFGAVVDGATDDTTANQNLIDFCIAKGRRAAYAPGTTLQGEVTIDGDVQIVGLGEAWVKRPTNFDPDNTAFLAQFDIVDASVLVSFYNLKFDGNEANQSAVDAHGVTIMFRNQAGTDATRIDVSYCHFINQTLYSVYVDGKLETNEHQRLTVSHCWFIDGRKGIGSGDPTSANSIGYTPFYIQVMDHIDASIEECNFLYRIDTSANDDYAPGAIRATYSEAVDNDDGPTLKVDNSIFEGLGRTSLGYDGTPFDNNSLGTIDFYGRAREVTITNNTFRHLAHSAIRGKSNAEVVTIVGNAIFQAFDAINITAANAESNKGSYTIVANSIVKADRLAIGVSGNSAYTPDAVWNVVIEANTIAEMTNIWGTSTFEEAAILVSDIGNLVIGPNAVRDFLVELNGVRAVDVKDFTLSGGAYDNIAGRGLWAIGVAGHVTITGPKITNCGGRAINVASSGATALTGTNVTIVGANIDGAADYGIILEDTVQKAIISSCHIDNISGLDRAISIDSSTPNAHVFGNTSNAATTVFGAVNTTRQENNSWNARVLYRSSAPSSGTWAVGDRVYNTAPSASGTIGWVCTTAGSPGTWKEFGNIAA